jgi:hypothetical protein
MHRKDFHRLFRIHTIHKFYFQTIRILHIILTASTPNKHPHKDYQNTKRKCRKVAKEGACGFAAKKERRQIGFIAYLIDNEHYDRCR